MSTWKTTAMSAPERARGRDWMRILSRLALACLLACVGVWGALALWFQVHGPWRWPLLVVWSAIGLLAVQAPWRRERGPTLVLAAIALAMLLAWWDWLSPSHARDWADDVAELLSADIDGHRVTLHNVRNFDWRTGTDYTPRWETRSYDLDQLVSADLILSYWMGPAIAHTLVSFGFADGRQLVFSLEIRKERHETFSAIGGFFRQFEAVLIAADERDIVRTRSNVRREDVFLYRLHMPRETLREVFLGYLELGEEIRRRPRFYNSLTSNCTTIVFDLARGIAPGLPLDYRLLLSGYFAEYVYEQGGLTPGYDYPALQAAGRIGDRARAADADGGDFSQAIRTGVPGIADSIASRERR